MSATAFPPTAYNLLELYRQHRDEIDVLTDQTSLFILAFATEMRGVNAFQLAGELAISSDVLRRKLAPLLRGQMMLERDGMLTVTALGQRVLIELGFIPPMPPGPTEPPKKPEPPQEPHRPRLVRRSEPATLPAAKSAGVPWGSILGLLFVGGIIITLLGGGLMWWFYTQPTPPRPRDEPFVEPQIIFTADRKNLRPGECATLEWNVQGNRIEFVELNGQRIGTVGKTQVCPRQTTDYILNVAAGIPFSRDVLIVVESIEPPPRPVTEAPPVVTPPVPTVRVITLVPPDTQGPPAPTIISPSNNQTVTCASSSNLALQWGAVSDPSGIASYRVLLQRRVGESWQEVRGLDVGNVTQFKPGSLPCGIFYRWNVTARDGAGNSGQPSAWATFGIGID